VSSINGGWQEKRGGLRAGKGAAENIKKVGTCIQNKNKTKTIKRPYRTGRRAEWGRRLKLNM